MNDEVVSVRCMQLPLVDMELLLPNSAVAEIIAFDKSVLLGAADDALLGDILWRGVQVPVVAIEALCGQLQGEPGGRSRIAIVYHPEGDDDLPYLGVLMQDIPRAYLAESDRLAGRGEAVECEFLSFRIQELMNDHFVPDLDQLFLEVKRRRAA